VAGHCIAVLLKYVDLRPSTDPLTGVVTHDPHGGLSASDQCALELALQIGESEQLPVRAVTAGGPPAEAVLRQALEAGAADVVRVDLPPGAPSADVAAALAAQVDGARFVIAGDYSLDRGSGSVPAFVAGLLGWAQVLGSAAVSLVDGSLHIERRLDRGRREQVEVTAPAVISVDGGLAPLRRAALPRVLQSTSATIPVATTRQPVEPESGRTQPFRPRPRVLNGPDEHLPTRERLLTLSGALTVFDPPRVVVASAEEAADELLSFLAARGYREPAEREPSS
ncbi:MAG TPA: mycofactocin-associated electron transfer flavoprotein beta subunit, partial [Acidimicrobiales bacterium]